MFVGRSGMMGLSEEITMTTYEPDNDLRLDPRVRAILKLMPTGPGPTYTSRDTARGRRSSLTTECVS
ncbi:MAG: hypothetical protein EBT09_08020 [Actinobacteria bacterium]|nr:hypothetical protein [Actinomycetota bacterium]